LFGLDGNVMIFTGVTADGAARDRYRALELAGAQIESVPANPHCHLDAVVARLTELEINDVWLEAGPTLAGAMLAAGLIDEFVLYLAPSLLGSEARGMFSLPSMERLDERIRLEIDDLRKVGDDVRMIARPVTE
jgi:diaminohydroxyphosphoribosylaminopyrimidine deaminase/5-amino-6-(5-phosphoribosylamino)uracil reductase